MALLVALMAFGATSCSDSDDDTKKAVGDACTSADECESNKCVDSKCVADDADKKDDGADCTKADECKSGFCGEDNKCAQKADDKKDDGADCTKSDECKSALCYEGKCGIPSGDCDPSATADACINGHFITCDADFTSSEATYSVEKCADNEVCAIDGNAKGCLEECTQENETKTMCDIDNAIDADTITTQLNLTCQKVGNGLAYVVTSETNCGNDLCDTTTNKCYVAPERADNGEKCKENGDCKSAYCKIDAGATEGVCTAKAANGADCTENAACETGYCDETSKKCAVRPSSYAKKGESCTNSEECETGFCSNKLCADLPKTTDPECGTTKACAQDQICNTEFKCVAKTGDKGGYGDVCTDDTGCVDGMKCHSAQKKCRIAQEIDQSSISCEKASTTCDGNVLISCVEDPYGDPMDMEAGYVAEISLCASKGMICATTGDLAGCMRPCEDVGASYNACTSDEELTTYTCTEVNGVKVFVPKSEKCSGMAGCGVKTDNVNLSKCL